MLKSQTTMSSLNASSSEMVQELLRLISKPSFKREDNEINFVLPWLCKRSQLLQKVEKNVLVDIVRNCALVSSFEDDVIIKQGERGDSYFEDFSFYIILRGSVSVYIDPKMTGEGVDESTARASAAAKRKSVKKLPTAPESEASILSGMEKASVTSAEVHDVTLHRTEAEVASSHEDADNDSEMTKKPTKLLAPLDRNKFGKFIMKYGQGGAFGELALVNKDTFRNATVVTDEDTDLMVIDQELFDRSLKAEQEAKYAEIREFIETNSFFKDMNVKLKKLLEMSIRKERYIFDTNIVRQGDPVEGLHFIISGSANIIIQPKKHPGQYPQLWPFEAGVDQIAIEFEHLREMRRAAILRKYEDPSVWDTKPEDLVIRREQGYAAIEKHMKESHINLCSVQNKEVLGDIETLLNLGTYVQTVRCTADTQCFVLDTKNFERLVSNRKANPITMDIMRAHVKNKLRMRMQMKQADLIPLLGYMHHKITEQMLPQTKKVEPFKTSKSVPDVEEEMQHLLQYFREGKEVMLLKPIVPGVVYYRELMHEKAKIREQQKKASGNADPPTRRRVIKTQNNRKPRSIAQIRESLHQMMEAEVIEMETKKFKKRTPKPQKDNKSDQQLSVRTVPSNTPRTLVSSYSNVSESQDSVKPGLIALMQAVRKADTASETSETSSIDVPRHLTEFKNENSSNGKSSHEASAHKPVPPVFVTELSTHEIKLPAIREEKTQEEIILREGSASKILSEQTPDNMTTTHLRERDNNSKASTKASKHAKSKTPNKQAPSIQISADNKDNAPIEGTFDISEASTFSKENVPSLPALDGSQLSLNHGQESARTGDTSGSNVSLNWKTAIKFVNQRVQDRLTKALLEEETPYKDFLTSEPSLKLLENRIQAFHIKYGMGHKTKNLPPLKRYKLDSQDAPKPGGRVIVKRQTCRFADTEYVVKDHQHVKHSMVEHIPDFDRVRKTKIVVQQLLKSSDNS
ncbi:hypothetical protein DPMN_059423 [Dreissena polymorpha]|uniref:Cyclic nucleotide-binding domain-containing protein n=1 Tax=Dreissena polymorpha TaxID=45954 RepID=A0A9D4C3H4_DREPO|nr:hypothetical protein DPMN_059423 [Dreissena polymorpha]